MNDKDWQEELAEFLAERGHNTSEVERIMDRVRQYEAEVQLDSVMDSIAGGSFDIGSIIAEALGPPQEEQSESN